MIVFYFIFTCYWLLIQCQNTNVTLLKYCLVRESATSNFRVKSIIDLTTLSPGDQLVIGYNNPSNFSWDENYGNAPTNVVWYTMPTVYFPYTPNTAACLIAYSNPVPNSILLCEGQAANGYFYFACGDTNAISFLQTYGHSGPFKALGYFLTYLPYDIIGGYNRFYFATCQSQQNFLRYPYIEIQPTTNGQAQWVHPLCSGNYACCADNLLFKDFAVFGLNEWPSVTQVSTNLVSTSSVNQFSKYYLIDNSLNNNEVLFTLGDVLSTSLTRNYQTVSSQSSSTSNTHGFTSSFEQTYGSTDLSLNWQIQITQTTQNQWTTSQSYENSQTITNGYTVTEDINLSGTIQIGPHCTLLITETYTNTTDIYLQQFLFNTVPSYTTYSVTTISPSGYKYTSEYC